MRRFAKLRALAIAATLAAPVASRAQVGRIPAPRRAPGDTLRRPAGTGGVGDTTRRDSTAADTARAPLIEWNATDSTMTALMARTGYTITRYQGDRVAFDAATRDFRISGKRAAVGRGETLIVSDTIFYNDSTQTVIANSADSSVVRDPTQGSDVVSRGELEYDIASRRAVARNVRTVFESDQTWFVRAATAVSRIGFGKPDSTGARSSLFYGYNGFITSCDDSVPDYEFRAKELKLVSKNILVARPAVLYIRDVPVFILPFIFQDLRSGRRSGILTPRFGVSELVRNSPGYRREFDNLGYYFNLGDYMDAQTWIDFRSGAGYDPKSTNFQSSDPGYVRISGEWRYRWLNRFMTGRVATSRLSQRDGSTNTSVSWSHSQNFSDRSGLQSDFNYVTNTFVQRRTTINPYQALATIRSNANYHSQLGRFTYQLGGSQTQYPGRKQLDRSFPNFSVNTPAFNVGSWLVWSPALQVSNQESLHSDASSSLLGFRYFSNPAKGGALDSTRSERNSRNTSATFTTPIRLFNFDWQNTFNLTERAENFPQELNVYTIVRDASGRDTTVTSRRTFANTFQTGLDWTTGFSLPAFSQGRFNISPSVNFTNVDPEPFWVRTQRTGGAWIHQSKRPTFGLSASPTVYGLFPGFGPFTRIRHQINPVLSYNYAPAATVDRDFLNAVGSSPTNYIANLAQSAVSLSFNQTFEAKRRLRGDSTALNPDGDKLKLLQLTFTPLTYDFIRADTVGNGFTTQNFGYTARSDLLPGLDIGVNYSLFQGDVTTSDTAKFKPYREQVQARFSINRNSGIFNALARVFGGGTAVASSPSATSQQATERPGGATGDDLLARQVASQPVAGSSSRDAQFNVPSGQGFQASFSFSQSRSRPIIGAQVLDLSTRCAQFQSIDPIAYSQCRASPVAFLEARGLLGGTSDTAYRSDRSAVIYRTPATTTLRSQTSFNITPKWAMSWGTSYDFRAKQFADQSVTLQRELHDWRAIFAFTQSTNGAFSFNFFISLNAEPDIKFNYDRRSYPRSGF